VTAPPMIRLRTLGAIDLTDPDGREFRVVLQQPKRLALLAYLAVSTPRRFHRRDSLLALFWPDLDAEHARAALRRALYFLRQQVGDGVVGSRGDEELRVGEDSIWCDASAFEASLDAGDLAGALALYQGHLLEGLYVAGAPGVEDWLDGARTRLKDRAAEAAWRLAEASGTPPHAAAQWARRAVGLSPGDEQGICRLLELLSRQGDRTGALRAYEEFVRRLAAEYELEPSADLRKIMEGIRLRTDVPRHLPVEVHPPPAGRQETIAGLVAVMPFAVHGSAAYAYLAEGAMALVSTALNGAGDLQTVDPLAVMAALAQLSSPDESSNGQLARGFGAELLVEGSITEGGGRLRATALLRCASDGHVLSRADAERTGEAELFDLVDDIVRQLLAARATGPEAHLAHSASLTTSSIRALKAYLAAEREFHLGRHFEAIAGFEQAVAADPSFALAHYRLAGALAAAAMIGPAREASARALEYRNRLTERDRLLLDAQHAWLNGDAALAERRYDAAAGGNPDDLEAWFLLGDLLFHSNPYRGRSMVEAREPLERALRLDPRHVSTLVKLARIAALEGDAGLLDTLVTRVLELSPSSDQALAMRALRAFTLRLEDDQRQVIEQARTARALSMAVAFTDVALYSGDLPSAARFGFELTRMARSEGLRGLAHLTLAHLELARGRISAASAELDLSALLTPVWTLEVRGLFAALPFLPTGAIDIAAIRAQLEASDSSAALPDPTFPLMLHDPIHGHLRSYLLGQIDARLGNLALVHSASEAMAEMPVPEGAEALVQRLARSLEAAGRVLQGRAADALRTVEAARSDVWYQWALASPFYAGGLDRFLRATWLEGLGRDDEALGWFGSIAERSAWELPFAAPAAFRMGEICDRSGDAAGAARHYGRVVELWKDCDEMLRPIVEKARKRTAVPAMAG
jgi:DNA-binding SARP family transcriptional activator/TolB-like protein